MNAAEPRLTPAAVVAGVVSFCGSGVPPVLPGRAEL
jgi:hypothetical protein